jgi:tight adherence protein B
MLILFLLTAATGVLTYALAARRMDRRDAAVAVRRLGARTQGAQAEGRHGRPRLIAAASEVRGRMTARLLEKLRLKAAAARLLDTAALKWGPAGLLHRSLGMFVGGFAAVTLFTGNSMPLEAVAAAAAAGSLPLWYARRTARKRVFEFEGQFPDCLEFISRSMRAGHAYSVAIEMAHKEFSDPVGAEFRRVFEEQNLGQPLDIVLRKLTTRVPSMDVQFFVSAVLLQKRTGGNLAELLDKLAQLIRERFKLRARIRAVSAQGLMSGRILSAIPLAVALLMFVVNPTYARFFIDDPMGHELMAAALGLQLVGYLIIRKIVTFEV